MHNSEICKIRFEDLIIDGKTCERGETCDEHATIQYGIALDEAIILADDVEQIQFYIHGKWYDADISRRPSAPDYSSIFLSVPKD